MNIREAIVDWLTGGGEARMFQRIIDDKDAQIRLLRIELARTRSDAERVPQPQIQNAGTVPVVESRPEVKAQELPLDWPGELAKMLKEEEDGIRSRRRVQIDEPGSDGGA